MKSMVVIHNDVPASPHITDTMKPFCAASRWNDSLMKGAIAPFSTQMAKQKSK